MLKCHCFPIGYGGYDVTVPNDSQCSFFAKCLIPSGYDVPILSQYLDWIAVMTYDYHGQWDKKTGHVAPMYGHPDDDNPAFNTVKTHPSLSSRGC